MKIRGWLRSTTGKTFLIICVTLFAFGIVIGALEESFVDEPDVAALGLAVAALGALVTMNVRAWEARRERRSAEAARVSAEADLVAALNSAFSPDEDLARYQAWVQLAHDVESLDARLGSANVSGGNAAQLRQERDELRKLLVSANRERDRERDELLLAPTWKAVNARLNSYHLDAQRQGRTAFGFAMSAMVLGFAFLAGSAWLALMAEATAGAVIAGGLGATSALVSGYVSKTFLRTYQETSVQLRGYFAQPVEAARFLFAERAIAVSGLPDAHRKELMYALVQAMATGSMGEPRATRTTAGGPGEGSPN